MGDERYKGLGGWEGGGDGTRDEVLGWFPGWLEGEELGGF